MNIIPHLLEFARDCWLPLLATIGLCWSLYRLGHAAGRRQSHRRIAHHIRGYRAQSIFRFNLRP